MLRALGIAFIVCGVVFSGVLLTGVSWWAISSGTVQIKGLNQHQSLPPAESALGNSSNQTAGESHAAVPGAVLHLASRSAVATAQPLAVTPLHANAVIREIHGITSDSTTLVWFIGGSRMTAVFPHDVVRVRLIFDRLDASPRETDFETGAASPPSIGDHHGKVSVEYNWEGLSGDESTVGVRNGTAAATARVVVARSHQNLVTALRNGRFQAPATPLSDKPLPVYGSYLSLDYQLPDRVSGGIQFYYAEASEKVGEFQLQPVRHLNTQRRDEKGNSTAGDAAEFNSSTPLSLAGANDGRLFAVARDGNVYLSSRVITLQSRLAGTDARLNPVEVIPPGGTYPSASRNGNTAYIKPDSEIKVALQRASEAADHDVVVTVDGQIVRLQRCDGTSDPKISVSHKFSVGSHHVAAALFLGDTPVGLPQSLEVIALGSGPVVSDIDASRFTTSEDNVFRVQFQPDHPVSGTASSGVNYELRNIAAPVAAKVNPLTEPVLNETTNTVELHFDRNLGPGTYTLTIKEGIQDILGQSLLGKNSSANGDFDQTFIKSTVAEVPTVQAGLTGLTGKHVEFPEYTEPRESTEGFNPSDKVVTRVARLYYFRDAHRVAQIVNRQAKSYNRQAVDMKQQFADAARHDADNATVARREVESQAVRAAQEARAAEETLEEHQQALMKARDAVAQFTAKQQRLDQLIGELENFDATNEKDLSDTEKEELRELQDKQELSPAESRRLQELSRRTNAGDTLARFRDTGISSSDINRRESRLREFRNTRDVLDTQLNSAQLQVQQEEALVRQLMGSIQALRTKEIRATERWESAEQQERLKAEEQFRREVAAKTEDPDTYAPGNPKSDDPVSQVSISVVGEGLIQLRGPRKGVNEVHKMINQLDAPVGQVKVAIHTVQVNGERGDRMEKVVTRIQRYLDHSRFLTIQSAEMLRNAVVTVASRQAAMVTDICPPGTPQQVRDYKYQEAFFGSEFLQELRTMDSEFLKTGNKVLSLHSMDTTSLSNALFLMSLAKNDVREQILQEFFGAVQCKLPQDELEFFEESGAEYKFRCKEFQFLGQNTKFTALRGFFSAEVAGPDTLNPMQREFIRLAQIFKSQLITEIELRQRVMERALIEERLGNYSQVLAEAARKERDAEQMRQSARLAVTQTAQAVRTNLALVQSTINNIQSQSRAVSDTGSRIQTGINDAMKSLADITAAQLNHLLQQHDPLNQTTTEEVSAELFRGNESSLNARILSLFDRKIAGIAGLDSVVPLEDWAGEYAAIENRLQETPKNSILRNRSEKLWEQLVDPNEVRITIRASFRLFDNDFVAIWDDTTLESTHNLPRGLTITDWQQFVSQIRSTSTSLRLAELQLLQFRHSGEFRLKMEEVSKVLSRVDSFVSHSDAPLQDGAIRALQNLQTAAMNLQRVANHVVEKSSLTAAHVQELNNLFGKVAANPEQFDQLITTWNQFKQAVLSDLDPNATAIPELGLTRDSNGKSVAYRNQFVRAQEILEDLDHRMGLNQSENDASGLLNAIAAFRAAAAAAENLRRPLDHKKFLDMLVDDVEEKYIELVEGTRAQTSNIDNYLKRLGTALEDDLNAQFYHPAFRYVRETSYLYDVSVGQVETTSVVANNRMFAKVSPQATMEFDLPKRDIMVTEAMQSALAAYNDYGALLGDPHFLSLMRLYGGQSPSTTYNGGAQMPYVQEVLPGLPSGTDAQYMTSAQNNVPRIGSNLEALIPDPAVYKFETGTGYEIRPVIQPDGQQVVFHFDYMYTTNVREPVRADEKHLGRVRRHFINTDVVSGNYELREVGTYRVGLKASRTSRGVPLLEDAPGVGILFRPLPSDESALQQNIILSQTVIYPTLFDLMGLRWAPAVSDLDALSLQEREFVTRNREKVLRNEVFDYSSLQVDEFMRIPEAERRGDLYRTQESIPSQHPNGYQGNGLNLQNGTLQEGYVPEQFQQGTQFVPNRLEDLTVPLERQAASPVLAVPVPPVPHNFQTGPLTPDPAFPSDRAMLQESEPPVLPTGSWPNDGGDLTVPLESLETQGLSNPENCPVPEQPRYQGRSNPASRRDSSPAGVNPEELILVNQPAGPGSSQFPASASSGKAVSLKVMAQRNPPTAASPQKPPVVKPSARKPERSGFLNGLLRRAK